MGSVLSANARINNFSLPFIVWMLIAGVIIAFIIIFCNKKIVGVFVSSIIDSGATSEDTAKTLSELGQEGNTTAISLYKNSSSLKKIILTINPDGEPTDGKSGNRSYENVRFYIPEDMLLRAKKQYAGGESVLTVIIGSVVLIAVGVIVTLFISK